MSLLVVCEVRKPGQARHSLVSFSKHMLSLMTQLPHQPEQDRRYALAFEA